MSEIEVGSRRNFAFVGHGGDGKTTLADSLLMAAGVTNRLGSVEEPLADPIVDDDDLAFEAVGELHRQHRVQ